jgi:hypothetical protein
VGAVNGKALMMLRILLSMIRASSLGPTYVRCSKTHSHVMMVLTVPRIDAVVNVTCTYY